MNGAVKAAEFYKKAFAAEVASIHPPDEKGRTMHAHVYINGSSLMMSDAYPEHGHPLREPAAFNVMLPVAGCRRLVRARRQGRLHRHDAARRHVLGRPLRPAQGPVRHHLGAQRTGEEVAIARESAPAEAGGEEPSAPARRAPHPRGCGRASVSRRGRHPSCALLTLSARLRGNLPQCRVKRRPRAWTRAGVHHNRIQGPPPRMADLR